MCVYGTYYLFSLMGAMHAYTGRRAPVALWVRKHCSPREDMQSVLHTQCLLLHTNKLQWRHNGQDDVSNHQPHDCILSRIFRRRSKKISKLHVTGLCMGNSSLAGEVPAQMASNTENVSIWWRHHDQVLLTHSNTWGLLLLTWCNFCPSMNK